MGVTDKPDGDHLHPLRCSDCGHEYWTDETMSNECPECYGYSWESRMDEVDL